MSRLPEGPRRRAGEIRRPSLVKVVSRDEPANEPELDEAHRLARMFDGPLEGEPAEAVDLDALRRGGAI